MDRERRGINRGRKLAGPALGVALAALLALVASASIQEQIDSGNESPVYILPGNYSENVNIYWPLDLIGLGNPTVFAADSSVSTMFVDEDDVTIEGFTVTGSEAAGIQISNASPLTYIVFNNIYGNGYGVANDNASPLFARYNFWGEGGEAFQKGAPGVGDNNDVEGYVDVDPWLTAPVSNGLINVSASSPLVVENYEPGLVMTVAGGIIENAVGGSAQYLTEPHMPVPLSMAAVKYFAVFADGVTGSTASFDAYYMDEGLSGISESSLGLYLWDGTGWISATGLMRNPEANMVSGSFDASAISGSGSAPILVLAGESYTVTILPEEQPEEPVEEKPIFSTFSISSSEEIVDVYYQIDGTAPEGWNVIQEGVGADTWDWPGWSISDEEWEGLSEGGHTLYFMFTRAVSGPVGDDGDISWRFTKAGGVGGDITLLTPNGGEVLNRMPFLITWELPSDEGLEYVDLRYSRDGGVTYPHSIARLSGGESYSWRSPNMRSDATVVRVTAKYLNGDEYSDESDGTFSIIKGYSFSSWRPEIGSGSFRTWTR